MLEYVRAVWVTLLLGFAPDVEIFVSIPVGLRLGLSVPWVVFWSVLGNYIPIPITYRILDAARAKERTNRLLVKLDTWLVKFSSRRAVDRFVRLVRRNPRLFIALLAPVMGIWAMAVVADLFLKLERRQVLIYSLISLVVYAVGIAVAAHAGFELFKRTHPS